MNQTFKPSQAEWIARYNALIMKSERQNALFNQIREIVPNLAYSVDFINAERITVEANTQEAMQLLVEALTEFSFENGGPGEPA